MVPCDTQAPVILPCHGWELCSVLDHVWGDPIPLQGGGGHRRSYTGS